jgi:hypothetical protein
MATQQRLFKVLFHNQGSLYEIYARKVTQGSLFGFVEVEDLVFGEKSALLVDPVEERLKTEFLGVSRTFIPLHSVVRIDEVDREGPAKVIELGDSAVVTPFPFPVPPPNKGPGKR